MSRAVPMTRAEPPPPITATCAIAGANAPVAIPAAHPLVPATHFLDWQPAPAGAGGVAMVQLDTWQMVAAFGRRFGASRTPADLPAALRVNPLTLALAGACWARTLNEYLASGLLNHTFSKRDELHAAIDALTVVNPANLAITTADWMPGEDTAGTPGMPPVPAVAGRPRVPAAGRRGTPGYVPAVPAVRAVAGHPGVPGRPALDAALDFLTLVNVIELEDGSSPWALIAYLAGMLGPCLSQAERNSRSSQV